MNEHGDPANKDSDTGKDKDKAGHGAPSEVTWNGGADEVRKKP